jgi:NAD(P)-dependent dehydrogenase (short-subunit alcohol dehydrogenase family)
MTGRVALVTGCSSGIGRHTAQTFLHDGWHVIATLRGGTKRADDLGFPHDDGFTVVDLDVTDASQRVALLQHVQDYFNGQLHCLVNNAGFALVGALEDISEAQAEHQMQVNFTAAAFLTRDLLPALRRAQGRIINISSLFGYTGFPLNSFYCASKYALEGFSEALRYELAPHGVQVALVEPGRHRTRFADNMVWGDASVTQASVYRSQTANLQRLRDRLRSRPAPAPDAVARRVVRLAGRTRMPLRTRVGHDATLYYYLERLLPTSIRDALFRRLYNGILLRGRDDG